MASQFVKFVNGMPTIEIGALRHQVTILEQTIGGSYDDSGVADSVWTTLATVQAAFGTEGVKRPDDVIRDGQIASQFFLEVVLWYQSCPSLLPNMRVLSDNGSIYVIQTAENVMEQNVVWVLRCVAIGPNV